MPGFGSGSFGVDPFGEDYWSERVLRQDWPDEKFRQDAAAEGFLNNWVDALKPVMDQARYAVRDFFDLRDPLKVRTRYSLRQDVVVSDPVVSGEFVTLTVTPASALEGASRGWLLESRDIDFTTWTVERVYKQITVGSTTYVGKLVLKGKDMPVAAGSTREMWLRPQAQIQFLGNDFGVVVDEYLPEYLQRSEVFDHDQWHALKGHEKSYTILGEMTGFETTVSHLWRVRCGFTAMFDPITGIFPITDLYEIPGGSGKFYAPYPLKVPSFDEIAADVIPADTICAEAGWSAFIATLGVALTAAVPFTTTYEGYKLTVVGDLSAISWYGDGSGGWLIRDTNSNEWKIESVPQLIAPGVWQFDVACMASSTVTPTPGPANMDYECRVFEECCWCGTNKIRVVVEYLSFVAMDARERVYIFNRLVDKLHECIPAHVEMAQLLLRVPLSASFPLKAYLHAGGISTLVAGLRYLYDVVESDVVETDQYLLVASLTY